MELLIEFLEEFLKQLKKAKNERELKEKKQIHRLKPNTLKIHVEDTIKAEDIVR